MTRLAGPFAKLRRRQQRGRCFLCGESLGGNESPDHLIPLARGGSDNWRNKVLAHKKCNFAKKDRMPSDAELSRFSEMTGHPPQARAALWADLWAARPSASGDQE